MTLCWKQKCLIKAMVMLKLIEQLTVEELKERARYISGKTDIVDEVTSGLKVLYSEMVGKVKICAVFDNFNDEKLKKLSSFEVDISPIPVQKLFIYLTNKN